MLAAGEKLNWLGLDMRLRGRRRVAVVGTYAAFLAVVWVRSAVVVEVVSILWIASALSGVAPILADVLGTKLPGVRRVGLILVGLLVGLAVLCMPFALPGLLHPQSQIDIIPWFFGMSLLTGDSVVAWNSLVDSGDRGWVAHAIRNHATLGWWGRRRLARRGFAVGLEGFASYEYGMRYKKLTAVQKAEIEAMSRANPQGKWMRERKWVLFDDERMRNEENRLRARVQRVLVGVLVGSAVVFSIVFADGGMVSSRLLVGWAWTLAGLATTLRQALVLWSEDDPRAGLVGELELVEG